MTRVRKAAATASWALALALFAAGCGRSEPKPVSVLLISVDTLRADRLDCYSGTGRGLSPNIDALAGDGILFENHLSASPWTTPAHMSLMTGLYPSTHGVIGSFDDVIMKMESGAKFRRLPAARLTLAEALASSGYVTGAFTGGITLDPKIGFDQGFMHYSTDMYKLDDESTTELGSWLDRHGTDPFFLFFHTFEVHAPYLETDLLPESLNAFKKEYGELRASLADIDSTKTHIDNGQLVKNLLAKHGALRPDVCAAMYEGGIRSFDRWFGRLIDDLRARGLYDRMLIVLTSDHGDEFADHHSDAFYDVHGHSAYQEIVHVPLIVKLPGQESAGTRVSTLTSTVDVMPTILDLLGTTVAHDEMQGESLRQLWRAPSDAPVRVAYSEAAAYPHEVKCIREGRYKYVLWMSAATVAAHGRTYIPPSPMKRELFDLQADPLERRNLLNGPTAGEVAAIASSLDARLRAFVDAQEGEAEEIELDAETIRRLRALGYME